MRPYPHRKRRLWDGGTDQETQLVPDVHAFPGHIACDAETRSEVVIPLVHNGALVGVFDLDSPKPGRFDEIDQRGLESVARAFLDSLPSAQDSLPSA